MTEKNHDKEFKRILTKEYSCGIDIGTKNLGFCFVSLNTVIGYRGTSEKMLRYETGKEILEISAPENENEIFSEYKQLITILNLIPEFEKTFRIAIEKQISHHNAEILRMDGIIFGFLSGKFPDINIEYFAPQKRISESEKIILTFPDSDIFTPPIKSIREQKIPSLKITSYFFPDFYSFILENIDDKKLDDLCDSLVYAIIGTSLSPINYQISKELKKIIKSG